MTKQDKATAGEQLYINAYAGLVGIRSKEYLEGARYILRRKLDGAAQQHCPYTTPSSQADAWMAGCQAALETYRFIGGGSDD